MAANNSKVILNLDQTDRLNDLLRWAHGTISLITCDTDLDDDDLQNAASSAMGQVEEARNLISDLSTPGGTDLNAFKNDLAKKLIEYERYAYAMPIEDVLARYEEHQWAAVKTGTDSYRTENGNWTEKGVRSFLALLDFSEYFSEEHYALTEGGAS